KIRYNDLLCLCQVDECTTPNRQQGDCKPINKCSALYSLLEHRPIPASTADYLRRSQCGFVGAYPKVCCPIGSSQPPTVKPPVVEGPTESTNVVPVSSDLLPNTNICGTNTQNRIYGGEKTDLDEFPWMALVEYEKPGGSRGFYCGGVLINKRYVLTAAHCVKGKDLPKTWKLVSVRLGEYNTETDVDCMNLGFGEDCAPPPVNIPVEEKIAHEDYEPNDINQYHDIALLRLKRTVTFNDYVKPICLPITSDEMRKSYIGQNLFVAGWGKTENRSESNVKLKVQVPVKDLSECSNTYSIANVRLGSGQLCAGGEKGRDSCRGDSGGPLMILTLDKSTKEAIWYAAGIKKLFKLFANFVDENCRTPNQKPGKCVMINHCPHIFSALTQHNHTTNISKDHIKQSHCGFESILFPKVCCPVEAVKLHNSKHAPKCGVHTPNGEADPWIALIEWSKIVNFRVNVRFGEYDSENPDPPLVVQIEDSVVHENYDPDDPNQANDIALVRLKKKVSKNGVVGPICLHVDSGSKIGSILQLAGWQKSGNYSFIKRAGIATVWNNTECNLVYDTRVKLADTQMCAGGKRKPYVDSYHIDIGGVLMEVAPDNSYSIVGIMSLTPPCSDKEDYPKVYTKISSYINWIFTLHSVQLLRKSQCGFSGTLPKVCCVNNDVSKELHPQTENNNYESVAKSSLLPDSKNCGIYEEDRMYRGEDAAEDEYPWNALLKYKTEDGKKEFYCAGVLISERYILTAAHCVKGRNLPNNTKLLSVRLGEDNIETNPDCYYIGFAWRQCLDPSIDVPVEQAIVHEDYDPEDPNQYHDIALLRLQSKVLFNETSKCEKALNVKLDQNQLCIGKKQAHKLCADDSGGSLVTAVLTDYKSVNFIVAAVKSFGTCDSEDRASVYTRVDDYIDWIISKLKP
ncbi:uncharacterized protein BDFB_008011, partial [Asbolus verrucosus]